MGHYGRSAGVDGTAEVPQQADSQRDFGVFVGLYPDRVTK